MQTAVAGIKSVHKVIQRTFNSYLEVMGPSVNGLQGEEKSLSLVTSWGEKRNKEMFDRDSKYMSVRFHWTPDLCKFSHADFSMEHVWFQAYQKITLSLLKRRIILECMYVYSSYTFKYIHTHTLTTTIKSLGLVFIGFERGVFFSRMFW